MHLRSNAEEAAEAHEERMPFFGIDVRPFSAVDDQRLFDVQPGDVDLERIRGDVLAEPVDGVNDSFHLDWTLAMRGGATVRDATGVSPAVSNLFRSWRYPHSRFRSGTGSRPVVIARRSTCSAWACDGRLITHSRDRMRFSEVCPIEPRPSIQLQPNHHADDIGAMFGEPSSLRELMIATGVPKYRIVGSIVLCMPPA